MELSPIHLAWRDRSRERWSRLAEQPELSLEQVASWEVHKGIRPVMDLLVQLEELEASPLTVQELADGYVAQHNVHEHVLELWARDLVTVTNEYVSVTSFGRQVHSEVITDQAKGTTR